MIPSPQAIVTDISPNLIRELINIFDGNECWKEVAHEFNIHYGLFTHRDIIRIQKDPEPSWRFLQHIASRCCTVGLLSQILRNMKLYDALSILVEPEPIVIIEQPGEDQENKFVFKGGELRLSCKATGLPPPYFIWFHENEELANQTTDTLIINGFSEQNEGEYHCCVYQETENNLIQVHSNIVNVEVHPSPPVISQHPVPEVTCRIGGSVRLSCIASGHPEPQYEWYKGNCRILGEECSVLNIANLKLNNSGHYRCHMENVAGEVWSNLCCLSVVPQDIFPGLERLTAKEKVALLIGNDVYCNLSNLKSPRNDVVTIAQILKEIGFKVITLHNLTLHEMRSALKIFCSLIPEGGYAIFHFAGHGFEMHDKFMLPIDVPGPESYLSRDSLCEKEVKREVLKKKPRLLFMLLDMCLKVPDRNENPHIHKEIPEAFVYEPLGNLITQYSTTSNLNAYERVRAQNSNYVTHLKDYLEKDMPLQKILDIVKRVSASNTAGDSQIPLYSSNVAVDIYLTDNMEENEETKRLFQKLTSLPQVGNIIKFETSGIVAGIKVTPHRNYFLNSLDIIISGLQKWHVGIQLSYKAEEGTVDRSGKCQLTDPEIMKSLRITCATVEHCLVITIHNLQRVKIPLLMSLFLTDPVTKRQFDSALIDLGNPLIAEARMWYNHEEEAIS